MIAKKLPRFNGIYVFLPVFFKSLLYFAEKKKNFDYQGSVVDH